MTLSLAAPKSIAMTDYNAMHLQGEEDEPGALAKMMRPFVDNESMDMGNDPRFFEDNVIDKRLGAFAGLGVVSGLMVDSAFSQVFESNKNFDWGTLEGWIKFSGFFLMSNVLFVNVIATYVAVAQLYHTMRLMTGGALGFEMCAAYYLNKNIVFWRHFAVKAMLTSLPVLLMSLSMKLLTRFADESQPESATKVSLEDEDTDFRPHHPHMFGCTFSAFFCFVSYAIMAIILYCIHWRHTLVFREKYKFVGGNVPFLSTRGALMRPAEARRGREPDV